MLPRAAVGGLRGRLPATIIRHNLSSSFAPSLSITRTYASSKRPPPPAPLPAAARQRPAPSSNARPPRQLPVLNKTSPGTGIPRQNAPAETAGTPAAADSPQEPVAQRTNADEPVPGSLRDRAHGTQAAAENTGRSAPLAADGSSQEPIAQRNNIDEPIPGSLRDQTHAAQAAAENIEPTAQTEAEQPPQSQTPLPDLRQGLPSTFAFEFGDKKTSQYSTADGQESGSQGFGEQAGEQERSKSRDRGERDRTASETSIDRRRVQMANYLYASILLIATGGALWLARPFSAREEIPSGLPAEDASGWSPSSMYSRVRARFGNQMGYYTEPTFPKLLPEVPESQRSPYTLVLSLEDLMIHSEWDRKHGYRMAKRPGLDYFIRYLSQYYELVLFTSAPKMMSDPVMAKLDPYHFVLWNLGREATKYEGGEYIKDLSYLNRPLSKTIIIDTHAPHVKNQPENAILLPKWSGDVKDPHVKDLVALIPFLEYVATMGVEDVRTVLKSFEGKPLAEEFARREAEARKKFMEQLESEKGKKPRRSLGALAGAFGIKSSPAMSGGMVLSDGTSVAEGLAQGKMLSDQIREQGLKQYEHIEKQIRENGAQWLKEEEEEQKKLIEASMKDMKKGWFSWFSKE